MIREIENPGETCAGGKLFVPCAVGTLSLDQVLDAGAEAEAGNIAARQQAEDSPGSL
jgi:hypothetical protein